MLLKIGKCGSLLGRSALAAFCRSEVTAAHYKLSRSYFTNIYSTTTSVSNTKGPPTFQICVPRQNLCISSPLCSENDKENGPDQDAPADDPEDVSEKKGGTEKKKSEEYMARHLDKDRTKSIPVEKSIRYLKSAAYKETYGDNHVWVLYRRNFPGQFAPKRTRKSCVKNGVLNTGNPCPICRDIYLVVHYCNVDLLKQFISPYNGEILGYDKTGVCRLQQENLIVAIEKAKDYGLITFDVPFREYDYKEYEKLYASY